MDRAADHHADGHVKLDSLTRATKRKRTAAMCSFIGEFERGRVAQRRHDAHVIVTGTTEILRALATPTPLAR